MHGRVFDHQLNGKIANLISVDKQAPKADWG
jgi:hypothetical protein